MEAMNRFLTRIATVMGWVALAFLAFMMVAISADVVARAIAGRSVPGLFEMSEMSLVMVVFMGLGITFVDDAHIRVTMLTDRLSPKAERHSITLAFLLTALTFAMLAWPASQEAAYSFAIREFRWGVFQMPIWWAKIAVAAGLWFAAVQALVHAGLVATGRPPQPARTGKALH